MLSPNGQLYLLYFDFVVIYAVTKLILILFTFIWWHEEIDLSSVAHSNKFTVFAVYR